MWNDSKLLGKSKKIDLPRSVGYEECIEPSSSYNTFGQWFKYAMLSAAEFDRAAKEVGDNRENPYASVLRAVRQAVTACLKSMGWTDINFSFAQQDFVLIHPDMGELTIDVLSDGARSVISMAADLAYRMVRLNPDLGERAALDTPGVVLIDEVDMHLHPSWQQTVLYDLQEAFPKVQFIVTTHSPQVLTSVNPESIRILQWGHCFEGVRTPEFSLGAESYQLLKDIQNVETRPQALPIVKDLARYLELVGRDRHWPENRPESSDSLRCDPSEAGLGGHSGLPDPHADSALLFRHRRLGTEVSGDLCDRQRYGSCGRQLFHRLYHRPVGTHPLVRHFHVCHHDRGV